MFTFMPVVIMRISHKVPEGQSNTLNHTRSLVQLSMVSLFKKFAKENMLFVTVLTVKSVEIFSPK